MFRERLPGKGKRKGEREGEREREGGRGNGKGNETQTKGEKGSDSQNKSTTELLYSSLLARGRS